LAEYPDVVVISDEVYDFLTFDEEHIPFATVGDNWKRTVTVYSGGKLLSATGWKVGWGIGPEKIIRLGGIIHNTTSYITNNPGQIAFANSLDTASHQGSGSDGK
jgi:kynurenine aminotransferase